jgi:hypothetical protein
VRGYGATGAELRYLPPYAPAFNPIEQLFAKLKALPRKIAVRSIEALWTAIGQVIATPSAPLAGTSRFHRGRGVYVRAQRGLLPPRASDMLAVRNRAIDGKGLSPSRFAALPAATETFTSRLSTVRSSALWSRGGSREKPNLAKAADDPKDVAIFPDLTLQCRPIEFN